jgi:hypothetical protein
MYHSNEDFPHVAEARLLSEKLCSQGCNVDVGLRAAMPYFVVGGYRRFGGMYHLVNLCN